MKKYRIVNLRRFIVFLSLMLIINNIRAEGTIMDQEEIEHYIVDGDTLWNLALEYMPDKYDVRQMVYEIKEINNLDNQHIYPGQIIKIPPGK